MGYLTSSSNSHHHTYTHTYTHSHDHKYDSGKVGFLTWPFSATGRSPLPLRTSCNMCLSQIQNLHSPSRYIKDCLPLLMIGYCYLHLRLVQVNLLLSNNVSLPPTTDSRKLISVYRSFTCQNIPSRITDCGLITLMTQTILSFNVQQPCVDFSLKQHPSLYSSGVDAFKWIRCQHTMLDEADTLSLSVALYQYTASKTM